MAEEETQSKKAELEDDGEGTVKKDADEDLDAPSADDLNSTMMAIDVSQLDLDGKTQTQIKIDIPSDDEIIQEQLEKKKSPVARFFTKIFKSSQGKVSSGKEWPAFLQRYVNVWLCERDEPFAKQAYFYGTRLVTLLAALFFQHILIEQALRVFETDHPSKDFYLIALGMDGILALLVLLFKGSPGWLASFPLALMAWLFAYGIYFFHGADQMIFYYQEQSISDFLNPYIAMLLAYSAIISVLLVCRSLMSKIFVVLLLGLAFLPIVLNFYQDVSLELSLFGPGFLSDLPAYYMQPAFILLHGLIPLLFFVFLFLSFGTSKVPSKIISRGFARGLCVLFMSLSVTGLAVMQQNRIPHVLNFIVPQKLDVGAVAIEVLNQKLKVETRSYQLYGGSDARSRYKMSLRKGQKDNQFLLQVVDEYDFPVKNLSKRDLVVYAGGKKVKKYKLKEDNSISYKRGSYILTIDLESKQDLVTWDRKHKKFSDKDKMLFNITDSGKVKRLLIREGDETFLDIKNLRGERYALPMTYFDTGEYKLEISAYDELDQKIFEDVYQIEVNVGSDVALLLPVQGDSVSKKLSVLVMPKSIQAQQIKSVSYWVDDKEVFKADEPLFFYSIDVSSLKNGTHSLSVKVETQKATITKTATFFKKSNVPTLFISKPSMGEFTLRQALVKYNLENASEQKIAGVKVYVNGTLFEDYQVQDDSFNLPVARWSLSEMVVSVQASLEDGSKVSDWVQVNKGLGLLDLSFDTKTLGFLNYSSTMVLVDASVSHLDNWQGKAKWLHLKKILTDPKVDAKIKGLNPGYMVFGAEKPYYYQDCKDYSTLIRPKQYNLTALKRGLSGIQPTGVSSLLSALKKALAFKPEKVFVFTDSADSCQPKMTRALKSILEKSPQTQIVVFALGQVALNDKKELKKMAEGTGGRFYQPDNYDIMLDTLLKELVLSYELYANDELILREPLVSRKFRFVPGDYVLKIPYGSDSKEVTFHLENGSKTTVKVEGKDKKIHVKVRETRL